MSLINDVATAFAAGASCVTAGGGVLLLRRQKSAAVRIEVIHTMVNQQRTDMMRNLQTMRTALQAAGIPLPVDHSLDLPLPSPESRSL